MAIKQDNTQTEQQKMIESIRDNQFVHTTLYSVEEILTGERMKEYGGLTNASEIHAKLVNVCYGTSFTAEDIATIHILGKIARQRTGGGKVDNFLDIIGYCVIALRYMQKKSKSIFNCFQKK